MIETSLDLAPGLADPELNVCLARVEGLQGTTVKGSVEEGQVLLALVSVVAAARSTAPPGARFAVGFARSTRPPTRGKGLAWDGVDLAAGAHALLAVRPSGATWEAPSVLPVSGPADPQVAAARVAAGLARGRIEVHLALVQALAGAEALPREALVSRLAAADVPRETALSLLAAAIEAAPDGPSRERLGLEVAPRFDPARWADRLNARVLTVLARALLAARSGERLFWARYLADGLRHPFDPAPERQERVARALVLLVDAPPVEMVAALEGLGGQGTPEDQVAVRDVLSLWLQL